MSKKFKRFLKFLVAGLLGLFIFCATDPMVTQASELYFDDEGNLYFHTRDRRAFGKVSYMTLGWIIKRYDMPMNAPGQEYVIVTKVNYKPDEIDPTDSNYVLSYFKSDKDEILNAVKSRSMDWYEQLYLYGDEVYIDSVMTVCNSGVPLGTLYNGGAYTGEVYFTYDTFVVARGWSSPHIIKTHFDMVVVFPQLSQNYNVSYKEKSTEKRSFMSTPFASFTIGAGEYQNETYSVRLGVPSGEQLYFKGALDEAIYKLEVEAVTATITQTVKVPCVYNLTWKDYKGVTQTEKRTVYRYYDVSKDYTYYKYKDLDVYLLSQVGLTGSIWNEEIDIAAQANMPTVRVSSYANVSSYLCYCTKESVQPVDCGTLKGTTNGIKPSIPHEDYSQLAENSIKQLVIRNDRVEVNGIPILGKYVGLNEPEAPTLKDAITYTDVYEEDISIPEQTLNGRYADMRVKCLYISEDGQRLSFNTGSVGDIIVHTPVICDGKVSIELDIEKVESPMVDSVVLRKILNLHFVEEGQHRGIPGYGYRDYSEYVGARRVKCPFPVIYKNVRYEANSWITADADSIQLTVCEDVPEGEYIITLQTWAYNSIDMSEGIMERDANLSTWTYGAWDTVEVRLIGKQYADYEVSGTH